jgi:hypothetical protein
LSEILELNWRAVVGFASFVMLITALTIKSHAQQAGPSTKEHAKTEEENTKASQSNAMTSPAIDSAVPQETPSPTPQTQSPNSKWHYGGFVDVGYLLDFNHPANRVFRSRGTTWHVDRPQINMAAFYLRKKADEKSRWGVELTAQAGKDAELFGFSATAPNIGGYKFLRQLGPTNISYLAPVGKGLTIQGGIFSSFIGYDSLYAKDNFNYTRPWGADFTPYFMMGLNLTYPFTKKVTGTFFVVNGYWHLAHANNVPSWGGQAAMSASPHLIVK